MSQEDCFFLCMPLRVEEIYSAVKPFYEKGCAGLFAETFLCRLRKFKYKFGIDDDIIPFGVILSEFFIKTCAVVFYHLAGALKDTVVIGFCPFFFDYILIPVFIGKYH